MHTVYLDTSVVSRIADLRIKLSDANALALLGERSDLHFVTSRKALDEILRTKDERQRAMLRFIYALMDKVRFHVLTVSGAYSGAAYSELAYGDDWTDPAFLQLQSVFERHDAEHIAQALGSHCDFFLTLDQDTILKRVHANRDAVRKICGSLEFASQSYCSR